MNPKILIEFVRDQYKTQDFITLHAPTFAGNEKAYVMETIDSTFVSSVGKFVDQFERKMESFTGSKRAVATVNGTAALHAALYMAGVEQSDLVITQALTFVATCNALYHMGAEPIFVDVSPVSLGLCPKAVESYLMEHAELTERGCFHKQTGQRIKAVVPMHTFGHPVELDELVSVCLKWQLVLVEDAAESLGSFYKGKHTGTLGQFGAISFNGNKIITTGGGGMVLCGTEESGKRTKHVTTTAKVPHPYEFFHDEPGFNYRMPNLNAALGCAQMEMLEQYLLHKRELANQYQTFFAASDVKFIIEPEYAQSNYWLNAIICSDAQQRDELLQQTNAAGVMTRPIWKLMHRLPMFEKAFRGDLTYSEFIEAHLINLPSTPVGI
ncbi:aminotransferase DegT [Shewanella xiamenensis]|uniref:LegC family aminotransferase n=1 Tax=Shewanella xiamenensis TaxID=332186 RepID=UPI001184B1D2|nr:LegC family aminotransferase [Shewanella xiamenensis]TVL24608.1 aminotransferase DegT [Shewanella xiamenensis]TVL24830.1 aminotransferase DegT [Shewanella xiamenensis]TVL38638.1 aminotransferase DegT [Shewanella xiamenensis]TVP05733.1 aminotransferase DegT [Shewanella xiamenensis]